MPEIGGLINNYRIVQALDRTAVSDLYRVEHITGSVYPGLLVVYRSVLFRDEIERTAFLEPLKESSTVVVDGLRIPLRHAGFEDEHPFLITPYNEEIEQVFIKQSKVFEQFLWRTEGINELKSALLQTVQVAPLGASRSGTLSNIAAEPTQGVNGSLESTIPAAASVLSSTVPTTPPVGSATPPPPPRPAYTPFPNSSPIGMALTPPKRGDKRRKRIILGVIAALLAVLIVWGAFGLHAALPAEAASIKITPRAQQYSDVVHVYVTEFPSSTTSVKGRLLTAQTQYKETIPVSGQGTRKARQASGNLVLSQIDLTGSARTTYLARSSLTADSGVTVTTDETEYITEGKDAIIPAHATEAGSAGNIGAYSINQSVEIVSNLTNLVMGTGYITNPTPFTGGTDARDYTFVKQADIDKIANKYVDKKDGETIAKVKKMVKGDEKLAREPECTSTVKSNHKVNDEASDVTVNVAVSCKVLAYTDQQVNEAARKAFQEAGIRKYGKGYAVVDNVVLGAPQPMSNGFVYIDTKGVLAYQYDASAQDAIKRLIAGEKQDEALQLLQQRPDIKTVNVQTQGWMGTAIPSDFSKISFVIDKVSGLKA